MQTTMVGVDCLFGVDGAVRVRRIQLGGDWVPVVQGRQWLDQAGRHVLVMLPGEQVGELVLRADRMAWELTMSRSDIQAV